MDKNDGSSVTHLLNLNFKTVDVDCSLWRRGPYSLTVVSALERALTVMFWPSRNRLCVSLSIHRGFVLRIPNKKRAKTVFWRAISEKNSVLEGDFVHIIKKDRTILSNLEFGSSGNSISLA